MKSGKRVLGIMLVSLLVISSISLVSAGFRDFFGFGEDSDLEGELANVDISLEIISMPEIVFVSYIEGSLTSGGVGPTARTLTQEDYELKQFDVYVWHGGGRDKLEDTAVAAEVMVSLIEIGGDLVNRTSGDTFGYCNDAVEITAPAGSIDKVGEDVKMYSCYIPIQYYDSYGNAPGNWDVRAYVKDVFGQAEGYSTTDADCDLMVPLDVCQNNIVQPARTTYFDILPKAKFTGGPLTFGTLSYGDPAKEADIMADEYPLKIENIGNADIPLSSSTLGTRVQAYKIPGTIRNDEYILVDWFQINDENPCTSGVSPTTSGGIVSSGMPLLVDGTDAAPLPEDEFRICLLNILETATPQAYSTGNIADDDTEVRPWIVDTAY